MTKSRRSRRGKSSREPEGHGPMEYPGQHAPYHELMNYHLNRLERTYETQGQVAQAIGLSAGQYSKLRRKIAGASLVTLEEIAIRSAECERGEQALLSIADYYKHLRDAWCHETLQLQRKNKRRAEARQQAQRAKLLRQEEARLEELARRMNESLDEGDSKNS